MLNCFFGLSPHLLTKTVSPPWGRTSHSRHPATVVAMVTTVCFATHVTYIATNPDARYYGQIKLTFGCVEVQVRPRMRSNTPHPSATALIWKFPRLSALYDGHERQQAVAYKQHTPPPPDLAPVVVKGCKEHDMSVCLSQYAGTHVHIGGLAKRHSEYVFAVLVRSLWICGCQPFHSTEPHTAADSYALRAR